MKSVTSITNPDNSNGGSSVDQAGDVIHYQVLLTNTGNEDLTNVVVSDPLVANLTKVSGDTIAGKTGSSLYSRIGTTHMSMPCLRMRAGRTVSSRFFNHSCCMAACSRKVPNGRVTDD